MSQSQKHGKGGLLAHLFLPSSQPNKILPQMLQTQNTSDYNNKFTSC